MQRCPVCNGRTIQSDSGYRCMNSRCKGAAKTTPGEGLLCNNCNEPMQYTHSNAYGEMTYVCALCGQTNKL